MRFWNETTGELQFMNGSRLYAHMPETELLKARATLPGAAGFGVPPGETTVPFPAFAVPGGRLSCVCFLKEERLWAAEIWVEGVGKHLRRTAERQRAFLFACLGAADPYPDSHGGVLLRCPFGTALVATDPRTGAATLRLTYR